MEFKVSTTISSSPQPQVSILTAILTTLFCILAAALTFRSKITKTSKPPIFNKLKVGKIVSESYNGVKMMEMVSGASIMEQLMPDITAHALSYLDYPSLCSVSMTNSLLRKAANDDNAWKALYIKDFTLEQDSIRPVNGWKAYYAATRAVVNTNAQFFNIIREGSLQAMGHFWLNADYVKCFFSSGDFFSGFNAVMENWQMEFRANQGAILMHHHHIDFQVQDVRVRVLTDCAWVTMRTYVDIDNDNNPFRLNESFFMTNVFELHNGKWFMVHHHSLMIVENGGAGQQNPVG